MAKIFNFGIVKFLLIGLAVVQATRAAGSTCGGVLETNAGSLEYSPPSASQSILCTWIIKLPPSPSPAQNSSMTSINIRFTVGQISGSSQLSLYPQQDYVAGQSTVLPISLTSANQSSFVDTRGPNMIVVWSRSASDEEEGQLTFDWDTVESEGRGHLEVNKHVMERAIVSGVNYVDSSQGKFSWKKPGLYQQEFLWLLNAQSNDGSFENSLELTAATAVERCDLPDPCDCSYFGVYEVYDNFLRIVTSNCGRSSSLQFSDLKPTLVTLAYVNSEYRQDSNFMSLSWKAETGEQPPTTTTAPPTAPPPQATVCPPYENIVPCICLDHQIACDGYNVELTQETVDNLFSELRLANNLTTDDWLCTDKELVIKALKFNELDVTSLLKTCFNAVYINGAWLNRIYGPLSHSKAIGAKGMGTESKQEASQFLGTIDTPKLNLMLADLTNEGLEDFFHYFTPSLHGIFLSSNEIHGPPSNASVEEEAANWRFLGTLDSLVNLEFIYMSSNQIGRIAPGSAFKNLGHLRDFDLSANQVTEIAENSLFMDDSNHPPHRTVDLGQNSLHDGVFPVNHGLERFNGTTSLSLWYNLFEFISEEKFAPFLRVNPENVIILSGNERIVCDERMQWLSDNREEYEGRVLGVDCSNDPGKTIFTTKLV